MSAIVPISRVSVSVRPATLDDIPFMDALQKRYNTQLGHFKTQWFEGYIKTNGVLIAESNGTRVGYVISRDRYQKRDELGIIYHLCVSAGEQRKLVGAELIKAVFDRSAYGCKLYCCWCAQDIDANYFWESIGFVPVAFRAGSQKKARVHIFWQRRIHQDDMTTPYWYPCQTNSGAMGEGRLVFPIPPGTHWKEVHAVAVPTADRGMGASPMLDDKKHGRAVRATVQTKKPPESVAPRPISRNTGLRFVSSEPAAKEKKPREKRPKVKIDPNLARAARELRDRYLERVNTGQLQLAPAGKYDVSRQIAGAVLEAFDSPTMSAPVLSLPYAA